MTAPTVTAEVVFDALVSWQVALRRGNPDADTQRVLATMAGETVTSWARQPARGGLDVRLRLLAVVGAHQVATRIHAALTDGRPVALDGRTVDFTLFPSSAPAAGAWALSMTADPGTPAHAAAVLQVITCCLNGDWSAAEDVVAALHTSHGRAAVAEVLVDLAELAASLPATVAGGAR